MTLFESVNQLAELPSDSQLVHFWWIAAFSEFVGTALLILLGNGVCAATSYKKMFANQSGKWICIALGWAFAVFLGATVSSAMGGLGHLNPAVTIFDNISATKLDITNAGLYASKNLYYIASQGFNLGLDAVIALTFFVFLGFQLTGAMFGQLVLNFLNHKFIKDTENDLLTIRGAHCTAPAYSNKQERATLYNFSYELIGTLVLVGVILALGHKRLSMPNAGALATIPVTFLIASIGLSLGSSTGYAINPVRDLGPRLIFVLTVAKTRRDSYEKGMGNFGYGWVPVVAPMVAGVIMGLLSLIPNITNTLWA